MWQKHMVKNGNKGMMNWYSWYINELKTQVNPAVNAKYISQLKYLNFKTLFPFELSLGKECFFHRMFLMMSYSVLRKDILWDTLYVHDLHMYTYIYIYFVYMCIYMYVWNLQGKVSKKFWTVDPLSNAHYRYR